MKKEAKLVLAQIVTIHKHHSHFTALVQLQVGFYTYIFNCHLKIYYTHTSVKKEMHNIW